MRPSTFMSATLAVVVHAAPTFPSLDLNANPVTAVDTLSQYFNLIASKVQFAKASSSPPTCDLSKAHMPAGLDGLPAPDSGTTVRHVAVGRGIQKYTCDLNNVNAAPKAAGAIATLYNASCVAALYPDVLSRIPAMAVHLRRQDAETLGPTAMPKSGLHYFDDTTPIFDLDVSREPIGRVSCAKNSSASAPATAAVGQLGEKAVSWLRLTAKEGTTGDIKDVYRVDTAGGSPPATCKDMPSKFQVEYSAVYWFWQRASEE